MQIRVVRGDAAHRLCAEPAFRAEWQALRERCLWATTFQEPGFVCAWYQAYRHRLEPVLVLSHDASGGLRGLLPLCYDDAEGMNVAGMTHAEYHAWICAPEDAAAFGAAALRAVRPLIPWRTPLLFQYLPPAMPAEALRFADEQKLGILRRLPRPILRLRDGQDIRESLKKSANRSKIKRLEKLGKLDFRQITDPQEFDRIFTSMVAPTYDLRQAALNGVAPFVSDPLKMRFHGTMIRVPGLLHATVMTVGDTIAAFHLGVPGNGELQLGMPVHNPWLGKHSPAKLHLLFLAQMLAQQGFHTFDLTPGGEAYKQRFASDWDTVYTLGVYRDARAQALGEVKARAAHWAKALLKAAGLTAAQVRALADRVRGRLRPGALPGALRAARDWVRGEREMRVYTLDLATLGPIAEDVTVERDRHARLLDCPPTPRWPTLRERATEAIARFEEGMHLYTVAHDGALASFGWLAERASENFVARELPGYVMPADAALVCDLYTYPSHRGQGFAKALLLAMLRDAAAVPGTRQVVLPVPAGCEAARLLVEGVDAAYAGSIRCVTRWGQRSIHSDFAQPAAFAPEGSISFGSRGRRAAI